MYIRCSTRLALPVAACAAVLPEATRRAAGSHPSIGFKIGPAPVRKRVRITIGTPEPLGDWLRIGLKWSAQPGASLFPVLDGYLQLEPLAPRESKLSLKADYQPPLGRVGQAIDHAALHTVARATLKDFVKAVGAQVLEAATRSTLKET
jgi:hypothetical protein